MVLCTFTGAGCSCSRAGEETVGLHGRYVYTADLLKMSALRPSQAPQLPESLRLISTPLVREEWRAELSNHPDKDFVAWLIQGLGQGFRIGFDYKSLKVGSKTVKNMRSAVTHPQPIDRYVQEELAAGRMIRLAESETDTAIHVSRFGVIAKPHQKGKWRLITDLSSPKGSSVNDGIFPALCSVSYTSIDDAVRCIMRLGRGAMMAKFDISSAYRIMPVHPEDRLLLGLRWRGELLVDGALPFGLRSAPKLFTALADALLWIMGSRGIVHAWHYLDDFLILGPPQSSQCRQHLETSLALCKQLGVPIAPHKLEGPSPVLSFLGIQIDSVTGTLSLPPDKLARLKGLIRSWRNKKCCRKRELLSLIGQLQHAYRVVRAGRTFLRRMIDLSMVPKELHHWVRLNRDFQSDLHWWEVFLEEWNGVALCSSVIQRPPADTFTSDASGRWGCGAFNSGGEWFQFRWPPTWDRVHITTKELLPIVVACAVWGHQWPGCSICILCDNAAVVAILRAGTSKDTLVMHLMRCLSFFIARCQLVLIPKHLPGRENSAADHLSRDALSSFRQLVPRSRPEPTQLPVHLMEALVHRRPDWTSASWRDALCSSFPRV